MKKINFSVSLLTVMIFLSSCYATMHTVGTGGKGDCKSPDQYDAKAKRWYLFWGALPLNNVDSKTLAGGASNYTIRTTTSFGDLLIRSIGNPLLGFGSQTIRVSKGDK